MLTPLAKQFPNRDMSYKKTLSKMQKFQSQTQWLLRQWPAKVVLFCLPQVVFLATIRQSASKPTSVVSTLDNRRVFGTSDSADQQSESFDSATHHTLLAQQASSASQPIPGSLSDLRWYFPVSTPWPCRHHGRCIAPNNSRSIWNSRKLDVTAQTVPRTASNQRFIPCQLYRRRESTSYSYNQSSLASNNHSALSSARSAPGADVVSAKPLASRCPAFETDIPPSYIYPYSSPTRRFSQRYPDLGKPIWPQADTDSGAWLGSQRSQTRQKYVAQSLASYVPLPRRFGYPCHHKWSRGILCTAQKPLSSTSRHGCLAPFAIFRLVLLSQAAMIVKKHTFLTINPILRERSDRRIP